MIETDDLTGGDSMIKSIHLANFGQHKRLKVSFERPVSVLVGPTGCGKSTVIAALAWVITNRPSGTEMIQYGQTSAGARLVVGSLEPGGSDSTISRVRTDKENSYRLDQHEPFHAIKTSVPDPIANAIAINPELSLQFQFDGLFWISLSPLARAAEFNAAVDLSVVDEAVRSISARFADSKAAVTAAEQRAVSAELVARSLDWVPIATTAMTAVQRRMDALTQLTRQGSGLAVAVAQSRPAASTWARNQSAVSLVSATTGLLNESESKQASAGALDSALDSVPDCPPEGLAQRIAEAIQAVTAAEQLSRKIAAVQQASVVPSVSPVAESGVQKLRSLIDSLGAVAESIAIVRAAIPAKTPSARAAELASRLADAVAQADAVIQKGSSLRKACQTVRDTVMAVRSASEALAAAQRDIPEGTVCPTCQQPLPL